LIELVNESDKTIDRSKDFYPAIFLSVIPFVVDSLYEKCGMEFINLLEEIDKLMSNRVGSSNKDLYAFHDEGRQDNLSILYNSLKTTIILPMGLLNSSNDNREIIRDKKKNINFLKSAIQDFDTV